MIPAPLEILLHCPECGERHIDEGAFATKPHHTHACQVCGMVWRPAIVPTVGVRFLPGFGPSVGCVNHPDRPVRVNLDGDDLCQECADAWARAEGFAAMERGNDQGY